MNKRGLKVAPLLALNSMVSSTALAFRKHDLR